MERMKLTFLHPYKSTEQFVMDVAPQATARQTIQQLLKGDDKGPWLDPEPVGRPYELVLNRTNTALAPNQTLGGAGAAAGDVFAVMHPGQGAAA